MGFASSFRLEPRHLHAIPDAAAVEIVCTQGSLWLTLDNDRRDIILEPGDRFEADAHRRGLLYALEPSAFVLYQLDSKAEHGRSIAPAV